MLYEGLVAGAPATVKEVIAQPTVNVKAVNTLTEPFVGVNVARMLNVPFIVPSVGDMEIVYVTEPDEV